MFDYFYGQSGEMFSYFRVPKILFRDIRFKDLSTDAKTLYGILLDRMSLSVKNGWLDGQGRVYIMFPIQEVMDALGCADNKAKILKNPEFDREKALEQQITLLTLKKQHLEKLIALAEKIRTTGGNVMDFNAFDTQKIREYAERAKKEWGETTEYQEF